MNGSPGRGRAATLIRGQGIGWRSRRDEVDLLFTDVGLLGGMNGRQLADEAKRLKPGLKVVFTTGYARDAIVSRRSTRSRRGAPNAYQALAAKLREILDARRNPPCILVIEDEVLVQMLVTEILGRRRL